MNASHYVNSGRKQRQRWTDKHQYQLIDTVGNQILCIIAEVQTKQISAGGRYVMVSMTKSMTENVYDIACLICLTN